MSNTLYLDETLTGFEREFAIESSRLEISMDKLNILYEAVDSTLNANYMEAELKVYAENGTYEDLAILYTEAEKESANKKSSILGSIFNVIREFCNRIKDFITGIFKKKVQEIPSDEVDVNEESYDTLKSTQSFGDMVKSGFANVMNASKSTLETLKDNIKKHKILATAVGIGAAAAGVTAGAAIHHHNTRIVKCKKSEVLEVSDQATKTMTNIDNATGNVEKLINVTDLTATSVSVATDNSTSDKGKAVNDTANKIKEKLPTLKDICNLIREVLVEIRAALQNLLAKKTSNPLLGAGKDNGLPAGNPSLGAGKDNGLPAGKPALGAGKDNGLPAGKPALGAGTDDKKDDTSSTEETSSVKKLTEDELKKLVIKFNRKLKPATKDRGKKCEKFVKLLMTSSDWKSDPAVQNYLAKFHVVLESVYDLFTNEIVADHFMTFYAESCDDYDYSIDGILDSI